MRSILHYGHGGIQAKPEMHPALKARRASANLPDSSLTCHQLFR
jgi:hypothetical protein